MKQTVLKLSEKDIDLRIKCAVQYTDITVLILCLDIFFYDLQQALTAEGKYRHKVKQAINRAMQLSVDISNTINDEMKRVNKGYIMSYTQLYDQMMETLQKSVLLTGAERAMSLIRTSLAIIESKLEFLHQHHHTFEEMVCVDSVKTISLYIRDLDIPYYDIEPIIRQALKGLVTEEEQESIRQRYLRAFGLLKSQAHPANTTSPQL